MAIKAKKVGKIVTTLVFLALPVIGWTQRWTIFDAWRLRNYQAPAEIAQLATDTTLNDKTRRLFYAYYPRLEDKQNFSMNCSSTERTIVLGCYIPGRSIHLFDVTDERLNGIKQVTAAHETLHAAYDRLSPSDKKQVIAMLNDAHAKLANQRIKDTLEDYRSRGADVTNELHSILATEVRELPPELERYYSRYFSDRKKIVAYSESYENAFNERKAKVAAADAELARLKQQIENEEAGLDNSARAIEAERNRLDSLLAANRISEYNAGVGGFNAMINAYNRRVNSVRALIEKFNKLVAERNAIAEEGNDLVKAIDSRPETIQAQ